MWPAAMTRPLASQVHHFPIALGILQFANMDAAKAWQDGGGRDIQEKVGSKYADFRVYAVEGVEQK